MDYTKLANLLFPDVTMTPEDLSDEVRETLSELRRRGYLLAIGSSSKNTKRRSSTYVPSSSTSTTRPPKYSCANTTRCSKRYI